MYRQVESTALNGKCGRIYEVFRALDSMLGLRSPRSCPVYYTLGNDRMDALTRGGNAAGHDFRRFCYEFSQHR